MFINRQKHPERFTCRMKRSIAPGSIMELSGEPVSKYRVKVSVPGRPEYILSSGAPTCLGHRSLFFEQQFGGWEIAVLRTPGNGLQILSNAQTVQLFPDETRCRLSPR
jgi:hypothetical protein